MNIEEFTNEILREVLDMVKDSLDIKVTKNPKNNGVVCPAISAKVMGENGGPSISLDGYFEGYRSGNIKTRDAAADVYRQVMAHKDDLKDTNLPGLLEEWETARLHIFAKLINRDMNRESLADMPHRDFLDLAVVYYVEVDGVTNEDVTASFMVKNHHMQAWEQDEESLYQAACSNMRVSGRLFFEDMNKVMREIIQEEVPFAEWKDLPSLKMYVLSNQKKLFGAAEILDGSTLKEIGDRLGCDYTVLPSSVNECMIVPSDEETPYRELADTVWEINREHVPMEERLSDHVYLYDREKGELEIVA